MPSSDSEDFDRLARDWVRRTTPQREDTAFRGKHGIRMEEWIDLETRKGDGFFEAAKKAENMARDALKEQDAAALEHGRNWNRAINVMHDLRGAHRKGSEEEK